MNSITNNSGKLQQLLDQTHWSEDDRRWLLDYLDHTDHVELRQLMQERFNEDVTVCIAHIDADRLLTAIHEKMEPVRPKRELFLVKNWKKLAVAASVVIAVGLVVFVYSSYLAETPATIAGKQAAPHHEIAPGRNSAILTLADGTSIVLDSAANGALAQQGNIKVLKLDGQIAYSHTRNDVNAQPVYNTIATAKGNQYQLILSDGSKVWLNAASSIRFPAAFTGNERRVEVTGEAYFEVAKNSAEPFRVVIDKPFGNDGEIEVLGTHFNVNAYDDEKDTKTTLLEGSVKVKTASTVQVLVPGQQARQTSDARIVINKDVDVSQVVAWKEGFFLFDNTDLRTLMRQVARWYDIEVVFEGKVPEDGFSGKISRSVPLSDLLNALELNDIHFKIEGRKITLIP